MNQKLDAEDREVLAAADKRQKRSLRFATLTAKLELQAELSDDDEDESDEEDEESV